LFSFSRYRTPFPRIVLVCRALFCPQRAASPGGGPSTPSAGRGAPVRKPPPSGPPLPDPLPRPEAGVGARRPGPNVTIRTTPSDENPSGLSSRSTSRLCPEGIAIHFRECSISRTKDPIKIFCHLCKKIAFSQRNRYRRFCGGKKNSAHRNNSHKIPHRIFFYHKIPTSDL